MTAEEEKTLSRRIRKGDEAARERMIRSNLRLVVSIAKHYVHRGLSLLDLISEGNLGLLKAITRYDPDQECRFSTYATWWIKQSIKRSLIDTVKTVRIPSYMVEIITKWKYVNHHLTQELDRQPTLQELARAMDLPLENVQLIRNAMRASRINAQSTSSDSGLGSLSDILEDKNAKRPDEELQCALEVQAVEDLLATLETREADILRMRFGLHDGEPMTLKKIGERVRLSRERIRQIEAAALHRLKEVLEEQGRVPEEFIDDIAKAPVADSPRPRSMAMAPAAPPRHGRPRGKIKGPKPVKSKAASSIASSASSSSGEPRVRKGQKAIT